MHDINNSVVPRSVYLVDFQEKTTVAHAESDGAIELSPMPSNDINDPLNWSRCWKILQIAPTSQLLSFTTGHYSWTFTYRSMRECERQRPPSHFRLSPPTPTMTAHALPPIFDAHLASGQPHNDTGDDLIHDEDHTLHPSNLQLLAVRQLMAEDHEVISGSSVNADPQDLHKTLEALTTSTFEDVEFKR
ncbi:hypothetical protein DFJ58DRAFT_734938 [Suillus subalutaceus]|uniref:uncharacterized protein n=1 Tax=Suillus subalutaceus TaxID=48586 RepID=UPI001B877C6C|nr:uncharacterized protein DFJ58DRAFT_734938 [Suillus subalutaceus]KAG1836514.1 hypothetical protein DFJ58DRAFT_734938 [Suillus subalutaceus]